MRAGRGTLAAIPLHEESHEVTFTANRTLFRCCPVTQGKHIMRKRTH